MSKAPQESVIFRARSAAPTEPGWFYARRIHTDRGFPVQVIIGGTRSHADVYGRPYTLTAFDWFGPVPKVEEASCPT